MKKIFLFVALLTGIVMQAFATIYTVSNSYTSVAQFSTIQAAVDSASNGDTIYVHGSPTLYANFSITDKKITVVGAGWEPDKNIPLPTMVNGCALHNTSAPGSPSGSELNGLMFNNTAYLSHHWFSGDLGVGNVRVLRCRFMAQVIHSLSVSNNLYESCEFRSNVHFTNNSSVFTSNILFQNNVFYHNGNAVSGLSNPTNVLFNHNLFYRSVGGNTAASVFSTCNFLNLSNNIFVKSDPATTNTNSTFTNNITYNCGNFGDTAWIRNNNTGIGNIAATNPQMAAQAAVDNGNTPNLLDFTITIGAANNAASDGKDIGLLFDAVGSLNWNNARTSRFPRITQMNVVNPTIAPGGTLNVTVEAKVTN